MSTLLPPAECAERHRASRGRSSASTRGHDRRPREPLLLDSRRFIEAVAADQPTMLVFEDLHWADEACSTSSSCWRRGSATFRSSSSCSRARSSSTLRPTGAAGCLRTPRSAPAARRERRDRAGAHRLTELGAGDERGRGDGARATGRWQPALHRAARAAVAETGDPSAVAADDDPRRSIAARLDALPPAERSVLLDAAVAGKVFWRGALERMTADTDALGAALGSSSGES